MTADERARRAADDVKASVATTDFDALRIRVRSRATAPSGWRRARPALEIAAVVLLVVGGIGLLARGGSTRNAAKFSAVGSSISAGGATAEDRAAVDAYANARAGGAQPDAQSIRRALDARAAWALTLRVNVTPAGAVADGSVRVVRAGRLQPGHTYLVVQCAARPQGAPGPAGWGCDPTLVRAATAPASGTIALRVTVRRRVRPAGAATVDCTVPPARCVLALVSALPAAGVTEAGVSPLRFEEAATPTTTP